MLRERFGRCPRGFARTIAGLLRLGLLDASRLPPLPCAAACLV